jgi:Protein of unknown function (DUF992)
MKKLLALIALCVFPSLPVHAEDRVQVGLLDCVEEAGRGLIVTSENRLSCRFDPAGNHPVERYAGIVRKFGLDIGRTSRTVIKWIVLAPSADSYQPGALAGSYGGLSAEATVGVGVGANALIGGSNKTFVLQPLSVQAQEGLNLAIGFTDFELHAVN